jgi:hypothetical protein
MSRERVLNHPGHGSQKSHGRQGGGGRVAGRDISGSADYDHIASRLPSGHDPGGAGDLALREIQREQGFDGKPEVVSRAEFDRAVANGEVTETFRGEHDRADGTGSGKEFAEQYRSGEIHNGDGVHGNGKYVATSREVAEIYTDASSSGLSRIGIRSDARVVEIDALRSEMAATYDAASAKGLKRTLADIDRQMYDEVTAFDDAGGNTSGRVAIYDKYRKMKDAAGGSAVRVNEDPGRFAALRGYDAIHVSGADEPWGQEQFVILNRTAVIVEEA